MITHSAYEKDVSGALLELIKAGLVVVEHKDSTFFCKGCIMISYFSVAVIYWILISRQIVYMSGFTRMKK